MKGIVFTEFLEMVENKYGFEVADELVGSFDFESGGVYTEVGTYPVSELVQMLGKLSKITNLSVSDLLEVFGRHLLGRFVKSYPHFFEGKKDVFDFLSGLEGYIHVEVKKLYPDAELPKIDTSILDDKTFEMVYTSKRKLADLAVGLINGAIEHFNESIVILREEISGDGEIVRFILKKS